MTELSRSVWGNLDLGRAYRPHCVRSILTTSVKILPYRPRGGGGTPLYGRIQKLIAEHIFECFEKRKGEDGKVNTQGLLSL